MKNLFNNWWGLTKKEDTAEELLRKQHLAVLGEPTSLENQYKLMTIRGIVFTYEDGQFASKMHVPEALMFDVYRKMSHVGILVESDWYEPRWTFDCTVDHIRIDYKEMDELIADNIITAFKHALNHARINGHTELIIHGSPILMNFLLPFMDSIEVYVNKLTPYKTELTSHFARLLNTSADVSDSFTLGNSQLHVTKRFETPSYKFYNVVNVTPVEVKDNG